MGRREGKIFQIISGTMMVASENYLCVQVLYSNEPYNVFKEFVWDPTEPVATRPLVFRYAPNSLNLFYAFDGNKNVSDVFYRMTSNGIGAHYDYAPFGATTRTHSDSSASFDIVALNPFRFSSEYYDSELDLVYYNYRHYSPSLGRFLSRDPILEEDFLLKFPNLSELKRLALGVYSLVENRVASHSDRLGLDITLESDPFQIEDGLIGLHQQICVDRWKSSKRNCTEDNKWSCCHEGKVCFTFALYAYKPIVLRPFSTKWLGWNSLVIGGVLNGFVDSPNPVENAEISGRHTTTIRQDETWFNYILKNKAGKEDTYSLLRHNCRTYSQWEFRDAPLHW